MNRANMCGGRARADRRCVDVVFVLDAARSGIRWPNPTYVFTHIEPEVYFNVGGGRASRSVLLLETFQPARKTKMVSAKSAEIWQAYSHDPVHQILLEELSQGCCFTYPNPESES